jgi:uncharacterized protein
MKYVVYAKYIDDAERVEASRPAHRQYADSLAIAGKLVAAGPFADGSGGLFIYEASSQEEVDAYVAADPFTICGAFASYETRCWKMLGANPAAFQKH